MWYCLKSSFRHPFTTVTCELPNPGTVRTSPVPWWGSAILVVVALAVLCYGATYHLQDVVLVSSNLLSASVSYLFGMSTMAIQRGKQQNGG